MSPTGTGPRVRLRDVTPADADRFDEPVRLERAGFVRDGVMRSAQFRAGAYHDVVFYGRLRTDP